MRSRAWLSSAIGFGRPSPDDACTAVHRRLRTDVDVAAHQQGRATDVRGNDDRAKAEDPTPDSASTDGGPQDRDGHVRGQRVRLRDLGQQSPRGPRLCRFRAIPLARSRRHSSGRAQKVGSAP